MARTQDVESAHSHLVQQVRAAKADVIGRLEGGDRDWDSLRRQVNRYIEFQTAADVLSGQEKLDTR